MTANSSYIAAQLKLREREMLSTKMQIFEIYVQKKFLELENEEAI